MKTNIAFFVALFGSALMAACGSPDPTKFTCANSSECPSGYFCNVAATHCAKGADTSVPSLLASTWDKTSVRPAASATLTFTTSKPVVLATVAPETAIHDFTVGAIAAVSSGAPNTYSMLFTAPAACDGAGSHPGDGLPIAVGISFKDSAGNSGTGPVGQLVCDVAKTISVDVSKVRVVRQPYPDGTVRTTVAADKGAVSSMPGFAGVSLVASAGSVVVGSSPANADGSVAVLELSAAPANVSLALVDRTGQRTPITGYAQRVVMSFVGKDVAGNVNPVTAWDTGSVSNSVYAPQQWVQAGASPDGGTITELSATYQALADGGLGGLASYGAFAYEDTIRGVTAVPPAPDRDGGTPLGWEPLALASKPLAAAVVPPGRVGHAVGQVSYSLNSNYYTVAMVGGAAPDIDGGFVDPAGTFYLNNSDNLATGWAQATPPTQQPYQGPGPYATKWWGPYDSIGGFVGLDSTPVRANSAIGWGYGADTCVGSCTDYVSYVNTFIIAGGTTATGPTSKVYAWGDRTHYFTGGNRAYTGWWDLSAESGGPALPFANAGMSSAQAFYLPTTLGSGGQYTPGMILAGGTGNTPTTNDVNGCVTVAGLYLRPNPPQYQVATCVDAAWVTASGGIGLRTGSAVATNDGSYSTISASYFLFGGVQSGSTTPAYNGAKNDLWQGTLTVTCTGGAGVAPSPPCPAGWTATRTPTWVNVTPPTGPQPPTRSGAGMAVGTDYRRLLLYGGVSATGAVLNDMWELDLSVVPATAWQWRQVALDAAPALAPSPRTKFAALNNGSFLLVGGSSNGNALSDVWSLSKTAPARMLIKAPYGPSSVAAAANLSMNVTVTGAAYSRAPLYIWDGTTWKFLTRMSTSTTLVSVSSPASYLQPDGNLYLMFMSGNRNQPAYQNGGNAVSFDNMVVTLDYQ